MRFLLDMSVSPLLRAVLVERGHEVEHCAYVGLETAEDERILERAVGRCQIIVTADHDFPRLVMTAARPFPGIVLLRLDNPDAATASRRLGEALDAGGIGEFADAVVVIEPLRVRVHRLSGG